MTRSRLQLLAKLYLILTVLYVSTGVLTGLLFQYLLPKDYSAYYSLIVLYYWLTGMLLNYALHRRRHTNGTRLLNVFMLSRIIKLFCTVVFLLLYVLIVRVDKEPFAICLMANYIIFSILEMYIYNKYNNRLPKNGKSK